MTVLCTDLDNTLIYSYKHDIGLDKINVEWYQGRELSFITRRTHRLLKQLKEKMLIIPTTTRTIEQYSRIDLGVGKFTYALVCNGGILLRDGVKDEEWYRESLRRVDKSVDEIEKAMKILEHDARRKFELRFIENLFVFTKCNDPETVVKELSSCCNHQYVDIFHNGEKVYVVPVALSKGIALERIKSYLGAEKIYAAGDSEFDISMLCQADLAFAPYGFLSQFGIDFTVREFDQNTIFSEAFLKECMEILPIRT